MTESTIQIWQNMQLSLTNVKSIYGYIWSMHGSLWDFGRLAIVIYVKTQAASGEFRLPVPEASNCIQLCNLITLLVPAMPGLCGYAWAPIWHESYWKLLLPRPASCMRSSHLRKGPRQAYLQSHSFLHSAPTKAPRWHKDITCRNMSNPQAASFQRILATKLLTCNLQHLAPLQRKRQRITLEINSMWCLQLCCRFLKLRDHRLCRFVQKFCHPQHWNRRVMMCSSNKDEDDRLHVLIMYSLYIYFTRLTMLTPLSSFVPGTGSRFQVGLEDAAFNTQSARWLPIHTSTPQSFCINPFLEEHKKL